MKRPLHIGTSPLTGRIYVGHVLKDGMTWAENKQDVTAAACGAVVEHVRRGGGGVTVCINGQPRYRIIVETLPVASENGGGSSVGETHE